MLRHFSCENVGDTEARVEERFKSMCCKTKIWKLYLYFGGGDQEHILLSVVFIMGCSFDEDHSVVYRK